MRIYAYLRASTKIINFR